MTGRKIQKIVIEYEEGYHVIEDNIDEVVADIYQLIDFASEHGFQFRDIEMLFIPKHKKKYIQ